MRLRFLNWPIFIGWMFLLRQEIEMLFNPATDVVMAAPVLLVVSVLGAVMSAMGQIQQGKAQQQIDERQAHESRVRADYAEKAGKEGASRIRRQSLYHESQNIATLGGSGVTLEGSPLQVMMADRANFELEALDKIQAGSVEARSERAQADIHSYSGKAAKRASLIGAGTTILSGLTSAGSRFIR